MAAVGGTPGADPAAEPVWHRARAVDRLLDRHGVAAFVWEDGEVTWANRPALDLVVEQELGEDDAGLRRRLQGALVDASELDGLAPGEERDVDLEIGTTRALLRVDAVAVRTSGRAGVTVSFRAPLERPVDPAHVARLEAMLDSANDIITVIDQQGRVRYSNPAAGRITGRYGSEANGASILAFAHPEDSDAVLSAFERRVGRGEPLEPFVIRIRMADGEWHHLEVSAGGDVELDGGETGTVVSLRDVSDRVRRDAEAERQRRRLESLVEGIDDVIVILAPDLTVAWTSPGIERLIDAPAYTNVGQHAFNDMHPEDVEAAFAAISSVLAEPGRRTDVALRLNHARFGWRWVEATVVNRVDDPAVEGLVCTLRDVTAQRDEAGELARLREQDREEMARLREADRLKDDFLATVSHELRTPLTAVRGFSEVLRQGWDGVDQPTREQLLDRISVNASWMESMIEQLLDLSRLQAGRVEVHLEPLSVDDELAAVVEQLELQLRDHEVVLAPSGSWALGDRFAFGHVVRNLLTNAAKYSNAGTRIQVEARQVGDRVHISVADEGIGIAPEDQRRVFQSFFQSAPAAAERRGTGVGLNVARRYAQLQAGGLDLHSVVGEGSTFTFWLPAAPADPGEPAP